MIRLLKKVLNKLIPTPVMADSNSTEPCEIINGSYQVSQCVIEGKVKINGEAVLGQNTLVKNNIIINGKLEASGVTFEADLFAHGVSVLSHCSMKGNAHFSGNVAASECHFHQDLLMLAHQATFSNCQINSIMVQRLPYVKTAQIISLTKDCVVTGNITFESGSGEVHLDNSAQIKGIVNGGKFIFN